MIQNRGYLVELKYSPTRKGKSADIWAFEPQIIPDRHRAGSTGQSLQMATNNSYLLEVKALIQLHLPTILFQSEHPPK
jgi:hypothetical protein